MNQSISTRQRFWLVFLLFLHTLNTDMGRVCISTAKGSMQKDISGLDDQMMRYVFGIFAIGYALFQIPAGWSGARIGAAASLLVMPWVTDAIGLLWGVVCWTWYRDEPSDPSKTNEGRNDQLDRGGRGDHTGSYTVPIQFAATAFR